MAKRIIAAFLSLVFALSLFSCEEQESYTEKEVLNYSFSQGKDNYSIKIIEKIVGEEEDSYVSHYIFEVLGPVEDQIKKYTYETKRYSRYSAPETFEEFIRKDSVLKKAEYNRTLVKAEPLTGKPLFDDNGQPIVKENKKENLYDLICNYQARHTFLLAAETCVPWFGTDYTKFAFELQSIRAKILSTNLIAQLCGTIEGKLDKKEDFSKLIVENIFKDSNFATKAINIGDFAETAKSSIEETNALCDSVAYITRSFTDIGITKLLEDKKALNKVGSKKELIDYVKTNYINSEAQLLCEELLNVFKAESKNKRLTTVDVKPDLSNEKGDSTQNTYTTNMSKIQSEKYAYPTFSFTYPSGWSVEKDEFDPTRTDAEYEWLVLKNERGVKITYYQNDFGFQQYYSAMGICEGTLTKVSDSDFVPTSISGADYSSLGKFVVAKLEVHTVLDHVTGEKSPSASDDPMYAIVPESYLGETSFSGSGYYGALSWEYPSPVVVFADSPQGSDFTKQEEKEVIEILSSFKEVPDETLAALLVGDFSAFAGTYTPDEEYAKDVGYATDFGKLTLYNDGKISAIGISCTDAPPISVIKQKDGSYRCILQDNRKKVEGPAYDYWEGTSIEFTIYPVGVVGGLFGQANNEELKNTVYIQYEAYSSDILAMLYCLDDSNS